MRFNAVKQLPVRLLVVAGYCLVLGTGLVDQTALAQRPFRLYDPFNRGETARRTFFDGYAFTTEVSYRSPGSLSGGQQTVTSNYGLSFRLDYEIIPNLDASAIVDAAGGATGRNLSLSWVALKYYRTVDNSDYAFRLAVDPAMDSRIGFPQADFAFISTTLLSPTVSSDYSIGVRHVRLGYQRLVHEEGEAEPIPAYRSNTDIYFTRAMGWEVHLMMQYSLLLDPARSNVFTSLLFDRGQYNIYDTSLRGSDVNTLPALLTYLDSDQRAPSSKKHFSDTYRGGAVWLRSGIEYNRPGYQLMPFFSVPLKQWVPSDENKARVSFGFRLMIR